MKLKRLLVGAIGACACWIACNGEPEPAGGPAPVDTNEIAGAGGVASESGGEGVAVGGAGSRSGVEDEGACGAGGALKAFDAGAGFGEGATAADGAGGPKRGQGGGGGSRALGSGGGDPRVAGSGGLDRGHAGGGGSRAVGLGGGLSAGGSSGRGYVVGDSGTGGHAQSGGIGTDGGRAAAGGRVVDGGAGGAVKVSIYLASDSTVQTYNASQLPQQGWGQRLQEFFTSNVTIVNKAMGGRSSKSFVDEGRLDEILGLIRPGDYLFAQWGINDRYTSDQTRYTNPATTFRTYLKMYVDGARSKNAIPVLVTPTPRLDYSNGAFQNDFPEYCKAILEVGRETDTPVIDLQSKGLAYYTSVGYDYVSTDLTLDVLHFKTEGAYQMARLVAEGVKELDLSISPYVK